MSDADAPHVVVTDATFPSLDAEERAARKAGARFTRADAKSAEEVVAAVKGAKVAVVQFAPLTREAVAGLAPGATAIRYGVGYDNFDVDALKAHGVRAAYVPDYCTDEVADHTAASILALLRKLTRFDASVRAGEWSVPAVARPLVPFKETVVGFLGFGRIAREVAARLRPFGMRIAAHDPFHEPDGSDGRGSEVEMLDLDTLLSRADALTLHAPATEETRNVIDAATLAKMKPSSVLVNTARGDLVVEADLARALHEGEIAAAALDVFEREPLPADSPLRDAPNLLLTPHAAFYSDASIARLQDLVADEIARALAGEPPRRPIPGTA